MIEAIRDFIFERRLRASGISEDEKAVARVNRLARRIAALAGVRTPRGTRFDRARVPSLQAKWRMACELHKEATKADGQEALARAEAEIRRNSAALHVERR